VIGDCAEIAQFQLINSFKKEYLAILQGLSVIGDCAEIAQFMW
jgi:hypothetical protein